MVFGAIRTFPLQVQIESTMTEQYSENKKKKTASAENKSKHIVHLSLVLPNISDQSSRKACFNDRFDLPIKALSIFSKFERMICLNHPMVVFNSINTKNPHQAICTSNECVTGKANKYRRCGSI